MSRNQGFVSIGDRKQEQRDEQRDNDRQPGHLGQDKRRFILGDGAGPGQQWTGLDPAMVAWIQVAPGMEVKATACRPLEVREAGKTDEADRQPDANEQADHKQDQRGNLTASSVGMHEVERVVHRIYPLN
ncbi:MAG: hypothetical protein HOP22_03320 [Nitrospiraceae bacterium]|nr:hypothetical protein [Nitrospiraceae bacterium]